MPWIPPKHHIGGPRHFAFVPILLQKSKLLGDNFSSKLDPPKDRRSG